MPEEVEDKWRFTSPLNDVFLFVLITFAAFSFGLSLIVIFLPMLDVKEEGMRVSSHELALILPSEISQTFSILSAVSPYEYNVTVFRPSRFDARDKVEVVVVGEEGEITRTRCAPLNATTHTCGISLSYRYKTFETITLYAKRETARGGETEQTDRVVLSVDWSEYEKEYGKIVGILSFIAVGCFALIFIIGSLMVWISHTTIHSVSYPGEYELFTLVNPFAYARTLREKFDAFLVSGQFWILEIGFAIFLLLYIAMSAHAFSSINAAVAFVVTGALAFVTPFLWTAAIWYLDSHEREPLRVIVSLFLWGGVAAVLSFGWNTLGGAVLALIGLGVIAPMITAPFVEEFFKGMGGAVFSLHHELDDYVDGMLYGFVIGCGFSFVENWLYLVNQPLGADVVSWMTLFFLRSIALATNHSVFTALTVGIIGWAKSKRYPYAPLLLPIAILPGAFLHMLHNSGLFLTEIFGSVGVIGYLCILMPTISYGGLTFVLLVFIIGVVVAHARSKARENATR